MSELNASQTLRVLQETLLPTGQRTISVSRDEIVGSKTSRQSDEARLEVLLELKGIPPQVWHHLSAQWGAYFDQSESVETSRFLDDVAQQQEKWANPHLDQVAAFAQKATKMLVAHCQSLSIVDWLQETVNQGRYLEVGPVFSSWPERILTESRWNRIESPVPDADDLPLSATWVHLRLRLVTGMAVGLRRNNKEPSTSSRVPEPTHPEHLNSELDASLSGDPIEDVLYRIKTLTGILGLPGAGKSTLIKWLVRTLILEPACPFVIPVFVSLREYAVAKAKEPSISLFTFFLRQCGVSNPAQVDRWAELYDQLARQSSSTSARETFFWLLDGWDEVPLGMRDTVLIDIQSIASSPGVVTSRHAASPYCLPCSAFYEIAPLSRRAQKELVGSWLKEMNHLSMFDGIWHRIEGSPDFRKLSRNPMLLTLLCGILINDQLKTVSARFHTRFDVYNSTLARIAAHHTRRHPESPFDIARIEQVEQLAKWLLIDAPESPQYSFTALDVYSATSDADLFLRILEPSRVVCKPNAQNQAFQFLHATFQEYLTSEWFRKRPVLFRQRVGKRILGSRTWTEIARFAAASTRGKPVAKDLWEAVNEALREKDNYGLLLARAATMLAEAGVTDGGQKLLGRNVSNELWNLIWQHRRSRPFLLIDALVELDRRYFIEAVKRAQIDPDKRLHDFPFLNELDEDIVAGCLDQDTSSQPDEEADTSAQLEEAVVKNAFDTFERLYHEIPSGEDGWELKEQSLRAAPHFGEKSVDFLVAEVRSEESDPITRGVAAEALRDCESTRARHILIELLALLPPDDPVVWAILGALDGYLLTESECKLVLQLLIEADDELVRGTAADVLSSSRLPGVAQKLVEAFKTEASEQTRQSILSALIEIADPHVLPDLWQIVEGLFESVTSESAQETAICLHAIAAAAIYETASPQNTESLKRLTLLADQWLETPGHPLAQTAVRMSIALGEELSSVLVGMLGESRHDLPVLIEACETVGRLQLVEVIPLLRDILDKPDVTGEDSSESLHSAAAQALGRISPAALLGIPSAAAERTRAQLAFESQLLFYNDKVQTELPVSREIHHLRRGNDDMAEEYQVGIYIALEEEFDTFRKVFGDFHESWKHPQLALTFYLNELPTFDGNCTRLAVCWSGEMGIKRAGEAAGALIQQFSPSTLVVIGIAGAIGDDIKLGDVLLPKEVVDYLDVSDVVDRNQQWTFRLSGNTFRSTQEVLNDFRNIKPIWPEHFERWADEATDALRNSLGEKRYEALVKKKYIRDRIRVLADDSKLASGPAVGKSDLFAQWLLGNDRKFVAMEMESVGLFSVVDITRQKFQPKAIAIRGISDFADHRKKKIENATKGVLRTNAMANAASLLKLALQCGYLGRS